MVLHYYLRLVREHDIAKDFINKSHKKGNCRCLLSNWACDIMCGKSHVVILKMGK
jgi:hypothetical protein